jgi:hypothetical protein
MKENHGKIFTTKSKRNLQRKSGRGSRQNKMLGKRLRRRNSESLSGKAQRETQGEG